MIVEKSDTFLDSLVVNPFLHFAVQSMMFITDTTSKTGVCGLHIFLSWEVALGTLADDVGMEGTFPTSRSLVLDVLMVSLDMFTVQKRELASGI